MKESNQIEKKIQRKETAKSKRKNRYGDIPVRKELTLRTKVSKLVNKERYNRKKGNGKNTLK
jgi:hypothetical protein